MKFGGTNMKRKLVFLSTLEATKAAVDIINLYFDKGYEIEEILDADCGYYIFLILNDNEKYKYNIFDFKEVKYPLIEEKKEEIQTWVASNTNQVKTN